MSDKRIVSIQLTKTKSVVAVEIGKNEYVDADGVTYKNIDTDFISDVLIDSNGCLLDNAVDEMTPVVVCDCLMEDFAEGLRRLTLDKEKYEARYN